MPDNYPVSSYKRQSVSAYLHLHFPDCKLGERYDHEADVHIFRLSKKGGRLVLMVSREFFANRSAGEISEELSRRNVAAALNRSGRVLVTSLELRESPE